MSVSLYYWTDDPVPAETEAAIRADLAVFEQSRTPWLEGVCLYRARDEVERLEGSTKTFRFTAFAAGEWQAIDEDDALFMAGREIGIIAGWLARVVSQHGLTWTLALDDLDLGRVGPFGFDLALEDSLAEMTGAQSLGPEDIERRAEAIAARHPPDWLASPEPAT